MLRALSSEQHFKSLEHEGKGIGAPPRHAHPRGHGGLISPALGFGARPPRPSEQAAPVTLGGGTQQKRPCASPDHH